MQRVLILFFIVATIITYYHLQKPNKTAESWIIIGTFSVLAIIWIMLGTR